MRKPTSTTTSRPYANVYHGPHGVHFRTENGFTGHEPYSAHNNSRNETLAHVVDVVLRGRDVEIIPAEKTLSETNLDALNTARKAQISDNREAFLNYFIGALSNHVTPENWASALDTAARCLQDEYTKRQARMACYRAEASGDNGKPYRPRSANK